MISDLVSPFEAFKHAPMGVCIVNPTDNRITYCNDKFSNKIGKTKEDIWEKNYMDVLGEEWVLLGDTLEKILLHDGREIRYIENAAQEHAFIEKMLEITYSRITLDYSDTYGIALWIQYIFREKPEIQTDPLIPLKNPQTLIHQLSRTNSFLSTVNARLKENQENLESAFDAGNLGNCGINFQTGEVTLSERGRNFFGISLDTEVTWEMLLEAVDPPYHEMVNKAFADALAFGTPVDSTYSITHLKTHETRWIRVLAKVHRDQDGKPLKVFGLVSDITEQKTDEQRKNDFIAIASHELKTPLTALSGYIQMLSLQLEKTNQPIVQNLMEKSVRQLGRISSLVDSFLHVSRFDSTKMPITLSHFDFRQFIEEQRSDAKMLFTTHQIHFEEIPSLLIYADKDKIGQILSNLINNAVKYSSPASAILVNYQISDECLQINVEDQGLGISDDDIPYIFNRFYRAEHNSETKISGFGIGLFICREIIEKHNGKIWVKSSLGSGSTFSFTVPIQPTTD